VGRGALIAIEGIDGAGKTTQARRLVQRLTDAGWVARYTKEPTDGPHGRALRASAKAGRHDPEQELALFLADRADHVRDELAPALAAGEVVVIDRYYLSTAAYQGARGLDVRDLLDRNEAFAPAPDLCLLIDVDPAVGVARVRGRDAVENAFEREDDLRRSRALFLAIDRPWMRVLDGEQAEDVIADEIWAIVLPVLPRLV
jgi:dTMP kinase